MDIIPGSISKHRVFAFPFKGYWQDVGTLQSYWETNIAILKPNSKLALAEWKVRTNIEEEEMMSDRSPSYISKDAKVLNVLLSPRGTLYQSSRCSSEPPLREAF